ncbi:MAG: bifunctional folylpolyglutamate synthase/dihydrofolate synthase [Nitrospirae bacterium]|nr:bifunctional folylpolyglutamate synthase/dihydrofolate synthase [Nitrospirota bacterium]
MTAEFNKYDATVSYLYGLQKHGIKLGLANINKMLQLLGRPHESFHSVHIAGTNGKGSTSAAIASILKESGFRTGLFTSPHLVSFTERIRINNTRVEEAEVIELASLVRDSLAGSGLNPTFFEFVTAMAFCYFAKNNVEWAVVETGMGGRLDATNVIQPLVGVITNISLDHSEFLGSAVSDITFEKAGIIKPGTPVITSSQRPEVIKQLSDIAGGLGSEIHVYGRNFDGSLLLMDDEKITFDYSGYRDYRDLSFPLTGQYQLHNACTAVRACEVLREKSFSISGASIAAGLSAVKLEGRMEWISKSPPILIDGAHNPEAACKLSESIRTLFPDGKIILVAGVMDDKDIKGVLAPLMEIAESAVLTKAGYDRAASPERLLDTARGLKESGSHRVPGSIMTTPSVAEALELAKKLCRKDNIILVTGSFYTTGEVKKISGRGGVLSNLSERVRSEETGK